METIRLPRVMMDTAWKERLHGKGIGLVPTMGALHEGHLSLIRAARAENDMVVASIFVNPMQFAPGEDLEKYPRDMAADMEKLKAADVDILFAPEAASMYPKDFSTSVSVRGISGRLCGAFRPGHFDGVATVVLKLFNIVQPARAYFGLKDYQQTLVIRKMAKDLDLSLEIVLCPTQREADGLAMSSRNAYLSGSERAAAPVLYRALREGAAAIRDGERKTAPVREKIHSVLRSEPLVNGIQYASAYDPESLEEPEKIKGNSVLLAAAIRIGACRLIDNLILNDLK